MKTKKAIIQWWKDIGNQTKNIDDRKNFLKKIDKSVKVNGHHYGLCNHPDVEVMFLYRKNWKKPLRLFFLYKECVKISI